MQIVLQSATFSYSLLPSVPLLPAPKIAGLLPAECPRTIPKSPPRKVVASAIIFDEDDEDDLLLEELERICGPFKTIEQMDADLAERLAAFDAAWPQMQAEMLARWRERRSDGRRSYERTAS